MRADLYHATENFNLWPKYFARYRARCDSVRRFTRARAPAAAIIANAIFGIISHIGMTGAVAALNLGIVFAALIDILNQQANRRTCGLTFKYAREDFDLIKLLALGDIFARARAAFIQKGLNVSLTQINQRRATINHAANGGAMTFPPCGETK